MQKKIPPSEKYTEEGIILCRQGVSTESLDQYHLLNIDKISRFHFIKIDPAWKVTGIKSNLIVSTCPVLKTGIGNRILGKRKRNQ